MSPGGPGSLHWLASSQCYEAHVGLEVTGESQELGELMSRSSRYSGRRKEQWAVVGAGWSALTACLSPQAP